MNLLPRSPRDKKLGIKSEQQQLFEQPGLKVIKQPNVANDFQERVAIFIDSSNLLSVATHLNIKIDYTKLLHYLTKKRKLLRAYFYTAVDSTNKKTAELSTLDASSWLPCGYKGADSTSRWFQKSESRGRDSC